MKTQLILATLFAIAATTASAQQTEYVDFSHVTSTKTRAEVVAELKQARPAPEYVEFVNVPSTKTRAEVIAEMKADRAGQAVKKEYVEFGSTAAR